MFRHNEVTIIICNEGFLPRCPNCGMCVSVQYLLSNNSLSEVFRLGTERRNVRHKTQTSYQSQGKVFTMNNQNMENVSTFRYLGREINDQYNDCPSMNRNFLKDRLKWGRISLILTRYGESSIISGYFYK